MTANGRVTLRWGDGEHDFNIARIGHILELEDRCGAGVREIFERLRTDRWRYNDLRETIRLALIGGGTAPADASKLVERYVDARPWAESYSVALSILLAAMTGPPDDPVGKTAAERAATEDQSASSAPPYTASAPPSDSPPDRSTT